MYNNVNFFTQKNLIKKVVRSLDKSLSFLGEDELINCNVFVPLSLFFNKTNDGTHFSIKMDESRPTLVRTHEGNLEPTDRVLQSSTMTSPPLYMCQIITNLDRKVNLIGYYIGAPK